MSTPVPQQAPKTGSSKMLLTMGSVGLLAGLLIVVTFQLTLPHIEANEAAYLEKSIFDIIPGAVSKQAFRVNGDNTLTPVKDDKQGGWIVYAGYDDKGDLAGVAIEARDQGFQDVIRIIYAWAPDKEDIVGMKVLQSTETPGLGDKIETDPAFRANFEALDARLNEQGTGLIQPIVMVKGNKTDDSQISAITGATISSRAIAKMIGQSAEEALPILNNNLETLRQTNERSQDQS